jgi:hypothetical protein
MPPTLTTVYGHNTPLPASRHSLDPTRRTNGRMHKPSNSNTTSCSSALITLPSGFGKHERKTQKPEKHNNIPTSIRSTIFLDTN